MHKWIIMLFLSFNSSLVFAEPNGCLPVLVDLNRKISDSNDRISQLFERWDDVVNQTIPEILETIHAIRDQTRKTTETFEQIMGVKHFVTMLSLGAVSAVTIGMTLVFAGRYACQYCVHPERRVNPTTAPTE